MYHVDEPLERSITAYVIYNQITLSMVYKSHVEIY